MVRTTAMYLRLVMLCGLCLCSACRGLDEYLNPNAESEPEPSFEWNSDYSSTGASLTLREADGFEGGAVVFYEFESEGFAPDSAATFWLRIPDGRSGWNGSKVEWSYVVLPASIDSDGVVAIADSDMFAADGFAGGQALDVALVSGDKRAHAKVYPYPIEASGGDCWAFVELFSRDGTDFVLTCGGFAPNEELTLSLKYEDRPAKTERTDCDENGEAEKRLVYSPYNDGLVVGKVTGSACEVTIEFYVGKGAFLRH